MLQYWCNRIYNTAAGQVVHLPDCCNIGIQPHAIVQDSVTIITSSTMQ